MKSESSIQIELWKLITAYRLPGVVIFHIPNGEKRDIRTARRLKEMGVVKGAPDLCYIADFRVGFLELKRENGRISDDQLEFIGAASWHLIKVDVAYSVIEAAQILQERGVLDPTIKVTVSDVPQRTCGRAGRTVRRRAVRPISEAVSL